MASLVEIGDGWSPSRDRARPATTDRKDKTCPRSPRGPSRTSPLTIKSTSGNLTGERFNSQNRAQQVVDRAIKEIPLDAHPERPYTLVLERDGRTLALGEKLAELDVRDGDTVIVQASQPVDG